MSRDVYAEEARRRWGGTEAWRAFEAKGSDPAAAAEGLTALFARLGTLKESDPCSPEAQEAIADLQRYITARFYPCTGEILAGLGEMYAADGRFTAFIDAAGGPGTARFASAAIRAYCATP